MRLPIALRFYLSMSALLVAAALLIRVLIYTPRDSIEIRTGIFLIVGVIPLVRLNAVNRYKYLCLVFLMAGITGLSLFVRDNLGCLQHLVTGLQCPLHSILAQNLFANLCYAVYLAIGFSLLSILSKSNENRK